jgi:hypothetical protein
MYYIGLDVHKKTISYCVKDASGQVHQDDNTLASRSAISESNFCGQFMEQEHVDEIMRGV